MKKGSKFPPCEHKGQKSEKKTKKSVTIIFKYFTEKDLGVFSVDKLSNRCQQKKRQKAQKNFTANHVTLHAAKKVIGRDIY
jgi:alanyl-tRNA synthetase